MGVIHFFEPSVCRCEENASTNQIIAMNIEELAKEERQKPSKKKGYDDVEISDISDEEGDKKIAGSKKKSTKKMKKSEVKGSDKREKKEKENEKKTQNTKTITNTEENQQKTPVSKTTEDKTHEDNKPAMMSIPKYSGPLPAGSEQKKKGCCVVL
ncbi:hypothetical protein RB195_007903 [Necator americanus]|uniref:Uncharacterized protein n=1 Tax=Necator americanus TaxID=51031 RepID=A0ABR1C100_NECAM